MSPVARSEPSPAPSTASLVYRTVWRWHFCAGLFVLPFVLILSLTGSIYLFKPQIDRWEERAYRDLGTEQMVSPDRQLAAAMDAFPNARFNHYRLAEHHGDAAMIQFRLADNTQREVYVSPQGTVLGVFDPDKRISETVARIHGTLLLGKWGDWLVELAASWTIVMILSGLYLWWPRPFRLPGTAWPRRTLRGRPLLKDMHRVTGFWIAGLVLVMLASGLPWAGAWGSAFNWARSELGLVGGAQDWKIGPAPAHGRHDHETAAAAVPATSKPGSLPLSTFVAKAREEGMAFPVLVLPPHSPQRFGPPTGDVWTVKSETQNRPLTRQVTYNPATAAELDRSGFADQHVIDRVVNTGIAWHEGQLFGWPNQLLGVFTALGLIATSILGVLMWLKRRPRGEFSPPAAVAGPPLRWPFAVIIVVLGVLLPLFGASVIAIAIVDRIVSVSRTYSLSKAGKDRHPDSGR